MSIASCARPPPRRSSNELVAADPFDGDLEIARREIGRWRSARAAGSRRTDAARGRYASVVGRRAFRAGQAVAPAID
jgi:hypothetical protein